VPLKNYTNYKIGGLAEYFLEFIDLIELKEGLLGWSDICKREHLEHSKIYILGDGTNILFSDEGYRGLILHNKIDFIKPLKDDGLEVGSGTKIKDLNEFCISTGLSGLEWSGGLPGTIGGAIFGNAGAFSGEIKDNIISVKSLRLIDQVILDRSNEECQFDYRSSLFKEKLTSKEIILSSVLKLKKGESGEIAKSVNDKIKYRSDRQPLDLPSAGSVFKNIDLKLCSKELIEECKKEIKTDPFPVIPIAYLIFKSGLIGTKIGGAEVSAKHPNFIVNTGNAKARDVIQLIQLIKDRLKKLYGIDPQSEIRIVN